MFGASWKTTVFGFMAAIGSAVLGGVTTGMIDVTHLPAWLKGAAGLMSAIGAAGLGLAARDNNVTSEQANAPKAGQGGMNGLLILVCVGCMAFCVGCASFVSNAQKSIYSATVLSDGAMKSYAVYWKDATNRLGDTPQLEQQRSNVVVISYKVGASLYTADRALSSYSQNVGTNSATKDVVNALILTGVQQAGNLAAEIGMLTGNTNAFH